MDRLHAEVAALKKRLRLQTLALFGLLATGAMAMGGADAAARAAVGLADAWKLQTKNGSGTATTRVTLSGDVAVSELKLSDTNLVLAQQGSDPGLTTPGTCWYDSTAHTLKFRGNTGWIDTADTGTAHVLVRKASDESVTSSTTLQDDDELSFAVGASQKWTADFWISADSSSATPDLKLAVTVPSGATVRVWGLVADVDPYLVEPFLDTRVKVATASGQAIPAGLVAGEDGGILLHVSVSVGATAGNVRLQWAQNTSNAASVTVRAGSTLEATRIQ